MMKFNVMLMATAAALMEPISSTAAEQAIRFLVESGISARSDCPITVALPEDVVEVAKIWTLAELKDGERIPTPHQFLGRKQAVVAWILAGDTPAKTIRTFEFRKPDKASQAGQDPKQLVTAVSEAGVLHLRHRGRPVFDYHVARVEPPEGIDSKNGRSGHIHPVWTPGGEIVSDEHPPDHPHQDGIFLAYTKTEFQGRQPNFWDLFGGTGFVRSGDVLERYDGPVCGGFRTQLEHVARHDGADTVALIEEWDVCCWNTGGEKSWRFDLTSRIRCATDQPLVIKEYHYGGMAFRGGRTWIGDNVLFTTADGKTREAGNHTRVPWVDLSGTTGGKRSGMTICTDPGNFRYPEPVRLHPTMPYFVFTPAVLGDWSIEPGKTHVSRYHYQVHDGDFQRDDADRQWAEISDPPRVAVRVTKE